MIAGPRLVAGLDVGSARTRAVVAEVPAPANGSRAPETLRVLGVGESRNEGVARGAVTNLEAAAASVRTAVAEAELMAGREVEGTYVGLPAPHAAVSTSRGVVAVSGAEVDGGHLRQVEEVGRAVPVGPDRELIHALCQEYTVDGRAGIEDPVGMTATRLESEVCIVTADAAACRELRKAVDRAGYRPEELVLGPLAAAMAVLGEGEREAGVALVDVGAASTVVAVFQGRRLMGVRTLRWGAAAVTRDIARGLGVPEEEAERLKEAHGAALRRLVDPADRLEITGPVAGPARRLQRELLAHIIEQRMDEILGLVYDELEEEGFLERLGGGVVLVGGGVALPGTDELTRGVFNLPVRCGEPATALSGVTEAAGGPAMATAVGLARYGAGRAPGGRFGVTGRWATRAAEWLRDFF